MYNIARKNTLGMHLKRLQKEFPKEYDFFPPTWIYPADFNEMQLYNEKKFKKRAQDIEQGLITPEQSAQDPPLMFIVKPEAGCQGKGIFIARRIEELQARIDTKFKNKSKELEEYLRQEESAETQARYA